MTNEQQKPVTPTSNPAAAPQQKPPQNPPQKPQQQNQGDSTPGNSGTQPQQK